jgi:TonB family protein
MQQLEERQARIETLQRKLEQSQRAPAASVQERENQAEIQRQLQAAQEEQRRQEEALEAEKQRLLEQARKDAEDEARKQALAALALETQKSTPEPTSPPVESRGAESSSSAPPAVSADTNQAATTIVENQFVDPTELDTPPAILKAEEVAWSRAAQRSRRRGIVVMQATVNAQGRVEEVKILRTDEEGFGIPESAAAAVKKYLFKPGIKNGVKVKTHATVTERYVFR